MLFFFQKNYGEGGEGAYIDVYCEIVNLLVRILCILLLSLIFTVFAFPFQSSFFFQNSETKCNMNINRRAR